MSHIRNLRFGHATNSSSSHSIVMMRSGHRPPPTNWEVDTGQGMDRIMRQINPSFQREPTPAAAEFGWDDFILADARSKMMYLAVDTKGRYESWEAMRPVFSNFLSDEDLQAAWNGYIDHQSHGTSAGLDPNLLLLPNVVVLGGNDNSDGFTIPNATALPRGAHDLRSKHDGDALILYSPSSGFKVRLSNTPYLKASSPELVDIKITDYCPYGCAFCYQGSTREGAHASLESLIRTADRLAEIGVFEVAIGGGEPMMHPDFPAIVRAFKDRGITPNVTSFGTEWLQREAVMEVISLLGGIGVSVQDYNAVSKVERINSVFHEKRIWGVQVLPQHAVGTGDLGALTHFLKENAHTNNLLLLGYKHVGRGVEGPSHPQTGADIIAALAYRTSEWDEGWNLSVDTAFVEQYPDVIRHLNVPEHMTSSPEGKFSMYIDLVRGVMAPSSYCAETEYVPLDLEAILTQFARW